MSRKEIHVTCPCCESRLEIDVLTQRVVKARRAEELDPSGKPKLREEDWDSAQARVSGRAGSAEDKFDSFLTREKTRGQDLDDLFQKLRDKDDDDPDDA